MENIGIFIINQFCSILQSSSAIYGIVVYEANDCKPFPCCRSYGTFTSPQKVIKIIEKIE